MFGLSNFAGGAAESLEQIIQRKFLEQVQRQKLAQAERELAQQAQRDAVTAELGRGRLGLDTQKLGEDTRQFDTKMGEDKRQFDTTAGFKGREIGLEEQMQPVRIAHVGAQTAELQRKPIAEQQERDFITGRDRTQHGYRLGEIGADAAEQRKTVGMRLAGAGASAEKPNPAGTYSAERGIRIQDSVNELVQRVSPWTAGVGSWLSILPATEARNFKADLDQLKANVAFSELTEMREASKTGGALGQVSNIELGLLQSALGALDQEQSPASLVKNLKQVAEISGRWQKAKSQYAGGAAPPSAAPPPPQAQEFDYVPGKGLVPRKR